MPQTTHASHLPMLHVGRLVRMVVILFVGHELDVPKHRRFRALQHGLYFLCSRHPAAVPPVRGLSLSLPLAREAAGAHPRDAPLARPLTSGQFGRLSELPASAPPRVRDMRQRSRCGGVEGCSRSHAVSSHAAGDARPCSGCVRCAHDRRGRTWECVLGVHEWTRVHCARVGAGHLTGCCAGWAVRDSWASPIRGRSQCSDRGGCGSAPAATYLCCYAQDSLNKGFGTPNEASNEPRTHVHNTTAVELLSILMLLHGIS
eukprot:SAG31_NODE_577_length_13952_cov_2.717121_3_plen_259_part_00